MTLGHVTIQTKYFEEEIHFFQKYVGMTVAHRMQGMGRNIVFLAGKDGGSNIEIIENLDAEDTGNEYISLGFKTEDVEKKRNDLLADGYEVTQFVSPTPNIKFFFAKDPAGITIQFM